MTLADSEVQPDSFSQHLFYDESFIQPLRQQMLKFAILQVQDEQLAEDAVQEAMISAYQHIDKFEKQAALKTWIFAILKNKLIDLLRKEKRTTAASQLETGECSQGDALMEKLFDDHGHWYKHERPVKWQQPDSGIENEHFWRVFDTCLNALPERYGRLFMMREFLELETPEICTNEEISVSHLNVTLYRARLRLRECLENNWYLSEELS
ncbi:RNA polymerase factor sigma-70 [Vibrio mangrovi]|uniref:RNA polymerase factor sigma-70 n=1 Tax=Vibrio mangrovi TaxID=474394 RepID=A0A1Y6IWM4_9VIBR|nr:RNA polymerase factor sigma-70 [Vibrio mangrovi]MDW6002988.1 RNA polymerase factor sigma-70 [Vibrio mangrovi]SMS01230.1 RNA polymerase sigma factor SigM [Vibrio mangrovi]